jgi:hypothetical protein
MTTQLACDIYCLLVRSRTSKNSRAHCDNGLPQGQQTDKRFFIRFFLCSVSVSSTCYLYAPPVHSVMAPCCVLNAHCVNATILYRLKSSFAGVNVKVRKHVVLMIHGNVICIKRKSFKLQRCANATTASLRR